MQSLQPRVSTAVTESLSLLVGTAVASGLWGYGDSGHVGSSLVVGDDVGGIIK
jgi:hypothetical protein